MSGADRLSDGFPHGTPNGYVQGCRGRICPAEGQTHPPDDEQLAAVAAARARVLREGRFRRVDEGR